MKTTIYLIRHTQTIGNVEKRLTGRKDYDITSEGNMYIDRLTKRLKDVKFQVAFCSTSGRTKKTIQRIADNNNIAITECENLSEMYFGIYDGMKWEEVNKLNPKIHQLHQETNEIMCIPDQETTEQVEKRMYNEISKIAQNNLGKNILICSHGVAIEAFLRKISGESFIIKREKYSQKTTSINIVEFDEKKKSFQIIKLNDFSHIL